jgi:hypothetical protein
VRFRAEIAGLIRREDTVALRAEVGEEGHAFALRRTVLLPFPTEPSWSSASSSVEADVYSSLPSRIRRSGFTALAPALPMRPILCSDWPAAPQFLSLWKFWMRPAGAARPPALGPCCASCCARR